MSDSPGHGWKRKTLAMIAAVGLIGSACASDGNRPDPATIASSSDSGVTGTTSFGEVDATIPDAGISVGSVTVEGTAVDFAAVLPPGFEPGDEAPVLLAFPPGPQDISVTESVLRETWAPEAQRLGWVVVSPAAPGGVKFFEGSEDLIPALAVWISSWVSVESAGVHVAGISNGGLSSFRFAAQNPGLVRSVSVLPGFPRSDDDRAALDSLSGVPVRLYVGGDDLQWLTPSQQAADTLEAAGADVELTVFDGEGHIIGALSDGVTVFAELESFR